jgi:tRNA modification GTPase
LLNALLGDERAIVSATAGTTRDTIEDTCIIGGKKFRFIDTAGIRETTDEIESEGIRRALDKAQGASIVLYLFDASIDGAEAVDQALEAAAIGPEAQTAIVWNKTDLAAAPGAPRDLEFHVSAAQGLGVEELKGWLAEWGNESQASDALMVTNFRHYEALVEARAALEATRQGLLDGIPGDLVASDVRQALHHLGSITGEIDPEDILDHIFSNFCIGK